MCHNKLYNFSDLKLNAKEDGEEKIFDFVSNHRRKKTKMWHKFVTKLIFHVVHAKKNKVRELLQSHQIIWKFVNFFFAKRARQKDNKEPKIVSRRPIQEMLFDVSSLSKRNMFQIHERTQSFTAAKIFKQYKFHLDERLGGNITIFSMSFSFGPEGCVFENVTLENPPKDSQSFCGYFAAMSLYPESSAFSIFVFLRRPSSFHFNAFFSVVDVQHVSNVPVRDTALAMGMKYFWLMSKHKHSIFLSKSKNTNR